MLPFYVEPGSPNFQWEYWDGGDAERRAALEAAWKRFTRIDPATGLSFRIWYRPTNVNLEVIANYRMPLTAPPGRYRIETFVPGRHATTHRAIFTVAHNVREENGEVKYDEPVVAVVDMYKLYDVWVPLGEFDLNPQQFPISGRVREYDITREEPPREIAYGPVRYVPLFEAEPTDTTLTRFDAPVGTQAEREGPLGPGTHGLFAGQFPKWTPYWYDINPFLNFYYLGYHTGADLNLTTSPVADAGAPIYAAADGVVVHVGRHGGWGDIIVIEHGPARVTLPNGKTEVRKVHTRYGHTQNEIVKEGETVQRGQQIGQIGLAEGATSGWHLHFDVSYSGILANKPWHWPDLSRYRALVDQGVSTNSVVYKQTLIAMKREVTDNYADPLSFIRANHGG